MEKHFDQAFLKKTLARLAAVNKPPTILSLGAGVQSSTLLLMACKGELPRPDLAIFADTQSESAATYRWLSLLRREAAKAKIRFEIVTAGCLEKLILSSKGCAVSIPAFGEEKHMLQRRCTYQFKIRPIAQRLHAEWDRVDLWLGISRDEILRAKDSTADWRRHVYPLIERGMTRVDCLKWCQRHGYPAPPKSACIFCPYQPRRYWIALQRRKEEWARAVKIDKILNRRGLYLHGCRRRLSKIIPELTRKHPDEAAFVNECEGYCGT